MAEGTFGLDDFLSQLLSKVRQLGLMKNPGYDTGCRSTGRRSTRFDGEVDRTEAIIHSMPEERCNPQILDGSRRARIAYGSGVASISSKRLLWTGSARLQNDEADVSSSMPGIGNSNSRVRTKKNKKKNRTGQGVQGTP